MRKSKKVTFKSTDSVKDLVYKAAERSTIWSNFMNTNGQTCTLGEVAKLVCPEVDYHSVMAVSDLFAEDDRDTQERYSMLVGKTTGEDRERTYSEYDIVPKNFVPPQKRKKVVRDIANLFYKKFKTVGNLRKRLNECVQKYMS